MSKVAADLSVVTSVGLDLNSGDSALIDFCDSAFNLGGTVRLRAHATGMLRFRSSPPCHRNSASGLSRCAHVPSA